MGISTIHRGDANEEEHEMLYFKRMAEYSCDDLLLPVIISMGNGKSTKEVLQYASKKKIPIVYFKKDTEKGHDAFVLTPDEEFKETFKATEHRFDLRTPWKRQRVERRVIETKEDGGEEENEISSLNEIKLKQNLSLDAVICYLLIGVSMESNTNDKLFGSSSEVYPNALCMYLLKEGKWKIPKDVIKKSFSHKSLEYITEESMTEKFEKGLWKELQEISGDAYQPPAWVKMNNDPQEHKLDVTISDLYGLIFYALLFRKFYHGAKQLLETGCVRIRHILVGCVILQKEENNWQTSQLEKEQLQQMHKTFSHHALRIISCIHDADNRSTTKKSRDDGPLGDPDLHSGRLLLNHGYLKDAIKTENKTFLDNEVVKDILNEKWYGNNKLTIRTILGFLSFSLLHFALLPVLMFTMEGPPFERIYEVYNIPFMKVLNNLVGFFSLLLGYAYMLLFNHEEDISYADIFLMVWIGSFLIDETKQIIIAVRRNKFRIYIRDPWNILDWLSMITYTCGMLLKSGSGLNYFNASKIFLVLAFILLSIRVLNLFCISELLGPKLVIIQKMFIDTFAFMAVMTVITMCYNVSYFAILYHDNSDFSFDTLEKVTRNGYWMLFGELNLEGDRVTEPDCSFDEAIYSSGALERCPSSLGRFLAPYLKALYVLVAVILMLNLLIAMYSYTFSEVHVKSKFYWSQLQTNFLEEYSLKPIFPFHMQWLAMVFCFIHFLIWKVRMKDIAFCKNENDSDASTIRHSTSNKEEADDKLNDSPVFVRVFLYDTNFDVKLKKTREAEGHAALKAKREMDIAEKDKIMVLKEKIQKMKTDFKTSNEKMMEELKKISKKMDQQGKDIKRIQSKVGTSRRSSISSTSSYGKDRERQHSKQSSSRRSSISSSSSTSSDDSL
ncbi:transient receptor potential cation channel subfamily M member 2-like [Ostrea edulis]|uniref:transient receptor potential cation channel subfamily M member 2-like n=1 Tax=Ostrea edulis TaxID=37623 RepID=UPI0024AEFFCF|nr:transient receptor potential cation channel subfamily M member 2-like [Ostrea edulis]